MTKYVIYGLGISGISTLKYFAKNHDFDDEIVATDDNASAVLNAQSKVDLAQVKFQLPDEINYDQNTVIIFSPGIPLYFPKPHKILEIVEKTKALLACDIEVFYRKNLKHEFIGITGTNGKSTTTALTGFILQEIGIDAKVGGNIGTACFDLKVEQNTKFIFETSSYQLDLLSKTHFKVASLLNITPDHIDRHGSMENYIAAKKRIFLNQTKHDFAVIDVDNSSSRKVFLELQKDPNFKAKLVPISTKTVQEGGVALIDGRLYNKIGGKNSCLELRSDFLKGKHNDQNMAFAFAIAYCSNGMNFDESKIITAIKRFKGLRHRLQLVGEIDGIKFINDSKATNAESSENALKAYDNVLWILGGKPKEGGINSLKPYFSKVIKAYLIGEASDQFAEILQNSGVKFEKCENLENAVKKAFFDAKNNGLSQNNILLSPACASFDQWKNFEQRGDYFCKVFNELQNSSNH